MKREKLGAPIAEVSPELADAFGMRELPNVRVVEPPPIDFGEPIHTYTRAEALEDGIQEEVTSDATAPYRWPVYATRTLLAELRRGQGSEEGVYAARLWDCCLMTAKVSREIDESTRESRVRVGRRTLTVRAQVGAVDFDDPAPAVTLGLPSDF